MSDLSASAEGDGRAPTLLLISSSDKTASPLKTLLLEEGPDAGIDVIPGGRCTGLVRQVERHAPDHVVVFAPAAELLEALAAWKGTPPCAVSWISAEAAAAELQRLAAAGLSGWWPDQAMPLAGLKAALAWDRLRRGRESALAGELSEMRSRLDDRKWLDRAKGLLAQAGGLSEDEAFKLLRGAAMHANLKIGDVSRAVIEAAAWADTLNRAGQLRMLSQRLVRLAAQRLAGLDVHGARELQQQGVQRVQAILDHLAAWTPAHGADAEQAATLARVQAGWAALKHALAQRLSAASVQEADDHANALLLLAEELTAQLEAASHRRPLRIVNLCGRQRMLTQRIAKDVLLADLAPGDAHRSDMERCAAEFESALVELEQAPLSNAEIRQALAIARAEWGRLAAGMRAPHSPETRLAIARASELLLGSFDELTGLYERNVQIIMS